jgi:hypothetical protein
MSAITDTDTVDTACQGLYIIGGVAALIAGVIFRRNLGVAEMFPRRAPRTVIGWFSLLQSDRLFGLAMLNVFDVVDFALLGLMFLALYAALRPVNKGYTLIATAIGLVGIAVYFASNAALSLLSLDSCGSDDDAQKCVLAAGQAIHSHRQSRRHLSGTGMAHQVGRGSPKRTERNANAGAAWHGDVQQMSTAGLTFRDALRAAVKEPRLAGFFLGTLKTQKKAAALRQQWEAKGVHVPPLMILSVTERCNLHCAGCYSQSLRSVPKPEMSPERMERLVGEASELGLSIVLLAGGEPLMKPGLLDVTAKYPKIIFPLLTNGYLLDDRLSRA